MAKFYDFNFGNDDPGPDTDPIPDNPNDAVSNDGIPDDRTNYDEPGAGDTFNGEDVSVWESEGNPEEPEAQTDQATSPIEIDSQSAMVPDSGNSYGRNDDPDAVQNITDDDYGDNESDDANPEDTISNERQNVEEFINPDDRYDELSYKSEEIPPQQTVVEIQEEVPDFDQYNEEFEHLLNSLFEDELKSEEFNEFDRPEFDDDTDLEDDLYSIDEYDMPGLDNILGSLDLNDYIGDVSVNSLIQEFQYIDAEELDDLL